MRQLNLLLELEPVAIKKLRAALARLHPTSTPTVSTLREVYWDNADHTIGHSGWSLASELDGSSRYQVAHDLRTPPCVGRTQVHARHPLAGAAPETGRFPELPEIAGAALLPIFGIDIERWFWRLPLANAVLHMRLDRAVTETAGNTVRRQYLELAVQDGDAAALYSFAASLLPLIHYRLASLDRMQAGYRLIDPGFPWPKLALDLSAAMTVRAGFRSIARLASGEFRRTVEVLEQDPGEDQVHQARVAARRLRSLLSVFGRVLPPTPRRAISADINRLAKVLGDAREADVWLRHTLLPLRRAIGPDPMLDSLAEATATAREQAAARIRVAVSGPDLMPLYLRLGAWFDADLWPPSAWPPEPALQTPLGVFAKDLLRRRHRKLRAAGAGMLTASPEALHEVRIMAKKLRYTVDFLRPLFTEAPTRRYLNALKSLQDIMGTANDAAVASHHMPKALTLHATGLDAVTAARGAGLVAGWSAAEGTTARKNLAKAWQDFLKTPRFWKDLGDEVLPVRRPVTLGAKRMKQRP